MRRTHGWPMGRSPAAPSSRCSRQHAGDGRRSLRVWPPVRARAGSNPGRRGRWCGRAGTARSVRPGAPDPAPRYVGPGAPDPAPRYVRPGAPDPAPRRWRLAPGLHQTIAIHCGHPAATRKGSAPPRHAPQPPRASRLRRQRTAPRAPPAPPAHRGPRPAPPAHRARAPPAPCQIPVTGAKSELRPGLAL
jgi:hypothetical protein